MFSFLLLVWLMWLINNWANQEYHACSYKVLSSHIFIYTYPELLNILHTGELRLIPKNSQWWSWANRWFIILVLFPFEEWNSAIFMEGVIIYSCYQRHSESPTLDRYKWLSFSMLILEVAQWVGWATCQNWSGWLETIYIPVLISIV